MGPFLRAGVGDGKAVTDTVLAGRSAVLHLTYPRRIYIHALFTVHVIVQSFMICGRKASRNTLLHTNYRSIIWSRVPAYQQQVRSPIPSESCIGLISTTHESQVYEKRIGDHGLKLGFHTLPRLWNTSVG